jgi:hypothetical protein
MYYNTTRSFSFFWPKMHLGELQMPMLKCIIQCCVSFPKTYKNVELEPVIVRRLYDASTFFGPCAPEAERPGGAGTHRNAPERTGTRWPAASTIVGVLQDTSDNPWKFTTMGNWGASGRVGNRRSQKLSTHFETPIVHMCCKCTLRYPRICRIRERRNERLAFQI